MPFLKKIFQPKASSAGEPSSENLSVWPFLKNPWTQALAYTLITLVHLSLISMPFMERLEFVFLDVFFRNRPALSFSPDIVYVEIAQDSIEKIGRWPWPRRYHAALIGILQEWGVHSVVIDSFFSEKSPDAFDDKSFAEALTKTKNDYAGVVLEDSFGYNASTGVRDGKVWLHSIPEIEKNLSGVGHVNVLPDIDGITRRVTPVITENGEAFPYIGIRVAQDYAKEKGLKVHPDFSVDRDGKMLINWAGRWEETYKHFSYWDVLQSYSAIQKKETPIVRPEDLKGKIVLIGLTAAGLTDIKGIPMQAIFPGVGVIANVINSVLTNQFVRKARWAESAAVLICLASILGVWFGRSTKIFSWSAAFILAGVWFSAAFFIFCKFGIYFQVLNPLLLILNFFIFSIVIGFLKSQNEQSLLYQLATRDGLTGLYVIRHMRQLLQQSREFAIKKNRTLSVIMSDIDFFKKINDGFGHDAGDVVLKDVARLMELELTTRNLDGWRINVGRYGGEEFIVLIENCDARTAANQFAEAIRQRVESFKFNYRGIHIPVTISLGVAQLHPQDTAPEDYIRRADEALYRAKHGGRNRVEIETPPSEKA